MSKAGKGDGVDAGAVGSQHPVPENIPHLSSPVNNSNSQSPIGNGAGAGSVPGLQAGSPIKEGSFLKSETSVDGERTADQDANKITPEAGDGIPIRG